MSHIIRNVVYGTIQGAGSWSTHLDVDIATSPTLSQAALDAYAEGVWSAFKTQMMATGDAFRTALSSMGIARGVQSYDYNEYGDAGGADRVGSSTSASVIGTSTPTNPPQTALCASLLTDFAGARGRGRMYLPWLAPTFSTSTLQVSTAEATALSGQVSDFIAAVQLLVPGAASVHVPVVTSLRGAGTNRISRVRVDTALDTIRARRDKVVPVARPATIVPVP